KGGFRPYYFPLRSQEFSKHRWGCGTCIIELPSFTVIGLTPIRDLRHQPCLKTAFCDPECAKLTFKNEGYQLKWRKVVLSSNSFLYTSLNYFPKILKS